MKKQYLHLIFIFALLFAVFFASFPKSGIIFADVVEMDTIKYVSLGDSIADGVGLDNYASKVSGELLADTYPYLFQQNVLSKKAGVDSCSYAVSGHETEDLLNLLNSDSNVINAVSNADVITICIGANDILQAIGDQVAYYIISDTDLTPYLDAGLEKFTQNFPKVLNKLAELAPNAKKIFTNIYNPYKELSNAKNDISVVANLGGGITMPIATVTVGKLKEIAGLTERYIAGGNGVVGLNQRLCAYVEEAKNAVTGEVEDVQNENCFVANSKANFDSYNGSEKLVKCSILEQTYYEFPATEAQAKIQELIDPHPTRAGHQLIYNAVNTCYENNLVVVKFDFDGGIGDGKYSDVSVVKKGVLYGLDIIIPTMNGKRCTGWINVANSQPWNKNMAIVSDVNLKAVWVDTFDVSFNSVGGGEVESQTIDMGGKVVQPDVPIKNGSTDVFVGWYYLGANNEQIFWDFENDVVTKAVTLVAKWANTICLNNNLLVQTINNIRPIQFKIDLESSGIVWKVNGVAQVGQNNNMFVFLPAQIAGAYEVCCEVNGKATKKYTVTIEYYVPTEIVSEIVTISDKNLYTFSIENGNFIDGSKCVWYATVDQFSNEAEVIGVGSTCTVRIATSKKVYVVYNDGQCVSNIIEVDPPMVMTTTIYIIIVSIAVIGAFVIVLTVISRKRFKNYY